MSKDIMINAEATIILNGNIFTILQIKNISIIAIRKSWNTSNNLPFI